MLKTMGKLVFAAGLCMTVLVSGLQAASPAQHSGPCMSSGNMCISITCPGFCSNPPRCNRCVD